MTCHGFAVTHVDALCHVYTPEGKHGMYNGFSISSVTDTGRRNWASNMSRPPALSDVECCSTSPNSEADHSVGHCDHAGGSGRCSRLAWRQVGEGDIVFVRTGAGPRTRIGRLRVCTRRVCHGFVIAAWRC